jgi:hypothetical protein
MARKDVIRLGRVCSHLNRLQATGGNAQNFVARNKNSPPITVRADDACAAIARNREFTQGEDLGGFLDAVAEFIELHMPPTLPDKMAEWQQLFSKKDQQLAGTRKTAGYAQGEMQLPYCQFVIFQVA